MKNNMKNNMKKIIATILCTTLFSAQSLKAEGYVGIDYLNNKIDTGITNISSKLDESDSGYSLFYGAEFTESLDIEASYQDFGEASLSGVSGNQFTIDGTTYEFNQTATLAIKSSSWGIAAKPKMNLNDNVTAYGKLGIHNWKSTFGVTATTVTASEDEKGTDVYFGAGIEISFDNLVGRVGYTSFDLDGEKIESTNFGLALKF
jgi:hypothetical protein